jgi:hypothetical protein
MTVLSCHRCLINSGIEKLQNIKIYYSFDHQLYVRVNVGIQRIVYFFKARCTNTNEQICVKTLANMAKESAPADVTTSVVDAISPLTTYTCF